MASTAPLDAASLELARSLPIESIPERLRCVTCDKLAFHAMKLPCCDNNICGDCPGSDSSTGYDTLNTTECPLCTHSPFSADTCIPAKALQTTTKVFIKNELKKRANENKANAAKAVTETPTLPTAESTNTPTPAPPATAVPADPEATPAVADGNLEASQEPTVIPATNLDAAPTTEIPDESMNGGGDGEAAEADQDDEEDDDDDVVITTERPPTEDKPQQGEGEAQQNEEQGDSSEQNVQMDQQQQSFGVDQTANGFGNGNFGNMNMNMNGFNPMMGMPGFGMGMPNMMGMMDPSMMFNGNFGGMGDISAMMGMGMNGMGGGMNGMGDFNGMGGPGFFPNQGNYMQSNYGNAHRQNFFNDRGYGRGYGRGFGRGRGNQYGRGRGGWGYQQQHQYGHNQQFGQNQPGGPQQSGANPMDVPNQRRGSPSYEAGKGADGAAATSGDSLPKAENGADPDAMDTNNAENTNVADESKFDDGNAVPGQDSHDPNGSGYQNGGFEDGNFVAANQSGMQDGSNFDESRQDQQQFGYGHNDFAGRGGFRGRGGFSRGSDVTELTPAPAPPVNAPTGPKAMRQGLPNTGWASRAMAQKPTPTPAPEVKAPSQSVEPRDERMQDGPNGDRGRSRTPDEYKRRSSKGKDYDDEEYESDETYARRKERERRKRKEREGRHEDDRDRDDEKSSKKYRSRSESRTDEGSRRRHRDKDDEHRSSRSHRDRSKDRQRRRHRSRSPAKDGAEDDEYSRRKSKSERCDAEYDDDSHKDSRRSRKHSRREDDYTEDRKNRSSKHERSDQREAERERPRTIIEPPSDELGFKIKGSRSAKMAPPPSRDRRSSVQSSSTPVTSSDPYAEERARATQDRVLKEAMRRQSSSTLGKRGRDGEEEAFEAPRGPKGDRGRVKKGRKERRIGYKYEDEVGGEDEREAGRWSICMRLSEEGKHGYGLPKVFEKGGER
ncbi:hypothetical protein M409DRAFT_57586 [Zasmidium cellare ATCC 36951]|uniref:RING-type domain-containing protein n=1 Tax=Zasmidium cellare ATCC 36951 TaxID=1080233 RepID=A0A6A6CC91_ZASCE|nr:uncharacterized protein M409DRAFT_57586 [Zasmidium cellare ATCC 36951]KAF2163299.1 hypothetical protein M409DRAFT_57586 [Zasmidium cellare ATCC 36951]